MSSKAQRVLKSATVSAFDWGGGGDASPAFVPGGHPLPAPPPLALPESAIDPVEEQRRLAEAERDAFTKGYAQGERSGAEAGATRAEAVLRRLAQTLEELQALRAQMIHKTERQVVQLAIAIAKRILHREVTMDHELLVAMARVALDRLGDTSSATIRLNPEDCAAGGVDRTDEHAAIRIVADPTVKRGGCRVESDFGQIDVAVDSQLSEIATALLWDDMGTTGEINLDR